MPTDTKSNYSIELPDDLREGLEQDAKENGRSLADHIRFVLGNSIKKSTKKK